MDKIRIGNDIHIEWSIFRDNQPEVFEGKDVEVRLIHTRTRDVIPLEWVISDGVVSATFYGKDQIDIGNYKLMLVENNGAPNMATIDECKAFTLVQCSCQEQKEEPSTSLQLHKVQLTSSFALSGGGNINVEGYPNVDELEEVKELSGNENIIITDSEGNKKTTIGNLKEYVVKDISELPPFRIFETESDYNAVKDELGDCVVCLRDTGVMLYHVYNKTEEGGGEIEDKYIRFADPEVQRILVENFSADKVGMTSEDIEKVTSIGTVFNKSTTITHFDEFSKFSNVTTLSGSNNSTNAASSGAFNGCNSLKTIKFPDSLLTINGGAFVGTSALEIDLKIPSLATVGDNIFKGSGIKRVLNLGNVANLGTSGTTNWGGEGFFFGCNKMEIAILPTTLSSIPPVAFYGCTALMALVFKSDVPPSLANTNALTNTNNCPFYVPDASVEAYKGATNWSSFASRIKGISELPSDNPTLYEEIKDYLS